MARFTTSFRGAEGLFASAENKLLKRYRVQLGHSHFLHLQRRVVLGSRWSARSNGIPDDESAVEDFCFPLSNSRGKSNRLSQPIRVLIAEVLIDFDQKNECLWNHNTPEYHQAKHKDLLYDILVKELDEKYDVGNNF